MLANSQTVTFCSNAPAGPNQRAKIRRFQEEFINNLNTLTPDYSQGGEPDELLIQAIDQTMDLAVEFASLAEVIAVMNVADAAISVYKGFDQILERYNPPRGMGGNKRNVDYDFHKFMGHELFVIFFSFLIREDRWSLIADLLEQGIYLNNVEGGEAGLVSFDYVSEYVEFLDRHNSRLQLNRVSVHADLLNTRHTDGNLARLVPMQGFMETDYFLFLRGEFQSKEQDVWMKWRPWSTLYMKSETPRYLAEAVQKKDAEKLLRALGVNSIETLRKDLPERAKKLARLFKNRVSFSDPLRFFNSQTIGSQ